MYKLVYPAFFCNAINYREPPNSPKVSAGTYFNRKSVLDPEENPVMFNVNGKLVKNAGILRANFYKQWKEFVDMGAVCSTEDGSVAYTSKAPGVIMVGQVFE